jgi:hypothetical protein
MNFKKIFFKTKTKKYLVKTIFNFLLLILFFPACAPNGEMIQLSNLKSNSIKTRKSVIFELHKLGKKAIPLLIQEIPDDTEILLLLNNPLSSTIDEGSLKNYSGVLAGYVVELILGKELLENENFFGNDFILGTNIENYIYYCGKIVNEKEEDIQKSDLIEVQKIYRKWWEENKHKSIEELRAEWKIDKKPLTNSKYHWK